MMKHMHLPSSASLGLPLPVPLPLLSSLPVPSPTLFHPLKTSPCPAHPLCLLLNPSPHSLQCLAPAVTVPVNPHPTPTPAPSTTRHPPTRLQVLVQTGPFILMALGPPVLWLLPLAGAALCAAR